MTRAHALLVAAVLATVPLVDLNVAHADEPAAVDAENALQLFKDGKALRDKGDSAGALEKFRAAYALVETPLTALELGRAYVALGQLIEAREVLLAVARMPPRKNESAKSIEARADAERLAVEIRPKLGSITTRTTLAPDKKDLAKLMVDGRVVPMATLGSPRLVNPGKHLVTLESGTDTVHAEVTLAEGESREVELVLPVQPRIAAPPVVTPVLVPVQVAPQPFAPPIAPEPPRARHETIRKVLMISGFGAAGVTFVVGSITGILTLARAGSLKDMCTADGRCPPAAQSDLDAASSLGGVSTAMFVAALVATPVGVAGYFLWRPEQSQLPGKSEASGIRVRPSLGGLSGTF